MFLKKTMLLLKKTVYIYAKKRKGRECGKLEKFNIFLKFLINLKSFD